MTINRQVDPIDIRGEKTFIAAKRTLPAKPHFYTTNPIATHDYQS